jgi:hypothetical protein
MDMIAHQAIAVQIERLAFLEVGDGLEEREIVTVAVKYRLAVVSAVDHVIDQPVIDRSQGARHSGRLLKSAVLVKPKIVLTPFTYPATVPDTVSPYFRIYSVRKVNHVFTGNGRPTFSLGC